MNSFGTYLENSLVRVGFTTIEHLTETGKELELLASRWNLGGTPSVERADLCGQAQSDGHFTDT